MKINARFIFLMILILTLVAIPLDVFLFIKNGDFKFNFGWLIILAYSIFLIDFVILFPLKISRVFAKHKRKLFNAFSFKWRKEDNDINFSVLAKSVKMSCWTLTTLSATIVCYWLFGFVDAKEMFGWFGFAEVLIVIIYTLISAPLLYSVIAEIRRNQKNKMSPEELELEEVREQNERMEE